MKNFVKRTLTAAMAAIMLIGAAGCNGTKTTEGNLPKVKWYLFSSPSNVNEKDIFAEANRMAVEKVGVDLEIIPLESANYEAKMQVLTASNEEFDIMFVSNWLNNYYSSISNGALVELDEYLQDFPKLRETIPDYFWDSMKVGGKIYGVPNQQIAARGPFFAVPKHNLELLNLDLADFENAGENYKTALEACEKYLRAVKEATGEASNVTQIWNDGTQMFNMEEVVGSLLPGAVFFDNEAEQYTLVNQYETEAFKYYINTRRRWVEEGLAFPGDEQERTLDEVTDPTAIVPYLNRRNCYRPQGIPELNRGSNYEWEVLFKTKPIMTSGSVAATINGISATSGNPEAALKVLELVNTDKDFYNLLVYGIEGVNYTKVDDNRISLNKDNPYTWSEWNVGNTYLKYLVDGEPDNLVEEVKRINDESFKSPLLGFSPDFTELKVEIAACKSAISEYFKLLDYGLVDVDKTYGEFISKLKAGGCDRIISEVQKQIDEWVAQK